MTDTPDPAWLAELRRLESARTPGDWQSFDGSETKRPVVGDPKTNIRIADVGDRGLTCEQRNILAHYIAACSVAVPKLLAELDRLRAIEAERDRLQTALSAILRVADAATEHAVNDPCDEIKNLAMDALEGK